MLLYRDSKYEIILYIHISCHICTSHLRSFQVDLNMCHVLKQSVVRMRIS